MFPLELLDAPAGSRLDYSVLEVDSLSVYLETTTPTAACPLCTSDAHRVHSRYDRRLADLPCFGRVVQLGVTVRRFFCTQPQCPRRIFAERLLGFAQPYARTTDRLRQAHAAIGCALGGEAGCRVAIRLSMTISPDTLLRRVKQLNDDSPPPRLVGIDDWAWQKGQRYGTIVVDLERGAVVDLLPDRDAETVKKWLNEHPGIELVSRDRSSAYAHAASEVVPQAQQVADRWHLLKNLREAIERLYERNSTVVGDALKTAEIRSDAESNQTLAGSGAEEATVECSSPQPPSESCATIVEQVEPSSPERPSEPVAESSRRQVQRAKRQRRVERFKQVHEWHAKGYSARRIARELGMSRNAVRRYLRRETCPDWNLGPSRPSQVDGYREWIDARLAEGFTNVVELHRQLKKQGFGGSYGSVLRYVGKRLGADGRKRERINAAKPAVTPPPSAKQLSFEWVRRPEKRKPAEQARLAAIRAGSDELAAALDLADEFAELIRKRSPGTLADWLIKGEASLNLELRRFAEGIRRDEAAVLGAMTQRWSNGPVEGHVNRLKTIKRQMYGRSGLVLLKARVVNGV